MFGSLPGPQQIGLLMLFNEKCASLISAVEEKLLSNEIIGDSSQSTIHEDVFTLFESFCEGITNLNDTLIQKIDQCVETLGAESADEDSLIRLIKGTMHPDSSNRLTAKKALKLLR
jgi:hypothetical protein